MLKKMKSLFELFSEPKLLKKLLSVKKSGYLADIGWVNSFIKEMPVDRYNAPLPWVTYSFIDFIAERLNKSMNIFEYGSGNSTLWYALKVGSVTSIEHDEDWFNRIHKSMPSNVNLNYKVLEYGGDYANFSSCCDSKFEIVIVDGRDRVRAMKNAINSIQENGVIVLDDSERESYQEGIHFLLAQGFKKIDFWGISPGLFYKKNTTIFYKENNCLDI